MASSRKKVLVRTEANTVSAGYLPLTGFVDLLAAGGPALELLDLEGRLAPVRLSEVRTVAWVRDFNLGDRENPERLHRTQFLARPRSEGLWVRLSFRTGDLLEGLAPLDLALLDGLLSDRGLFLIPPDVRSNTQRLFVPRSAMETLQILAVITTPSKQARPAPPASARGDLMGDLFPPGPRE